MKQSLTLKVYLKNRALLFNKTHKKEPSIQDVSVYPTIAYGNDPLQTLDVYLPDDTAYALPVIIFIPGSSWVSDYLFDAFDTFLSLLAKEGFAVIKMRYRLAPDVHLKTQIQDVFSVIEYATMKEKVHQFNDNQVFLMGDEAGAHLAALTASICYSKTLQETFNVNCDIKLKGLSLSNGNYDLNTFLNGNFKPHRKEMIKCLFQLKEYKQDTNFNLAQITETIKNEYPPTFLIGTDEQTMLLKQRLALNNIEHTKFTPSESLDYKQFYFKESKERTLLVDTLSQYFKQVI